MNSEFQRLWRRGRPYRTRLFLGLGAALVAAVFSPIMAKLTGFMIEWLRKADEYAARGELVERVVFMALLVPVLGLLKGASTYTASYLLAWNAQGILTDLRRDLYDSLITRPLSFFGKRHSGEFISRVTNDVQRLEVGLSHRLTDLVMNIPVAIAILIFLWWESWQMAFVGTVLLPALAIPLSGWARKLKRASKEAQEHTESLSGVMSETLGGIRVVKAYLAESLERSRFAALNERLRRVNLRAYRTKAAASPVLESALAPVLVGLFALAVYLKVTPEDFAEFAAAMSMLYRATKKIANANNEMANVTAASARCFDMLDDTQHVEPTGGKDAAPLRDKIEFDRVCFSHGDIPIVKDFTLSVKRGEVIALVGESGAGKTTLTNLLVRFLDADSGCLSWDGDDLQELSPSSLRAQVALVTQDTIVFDDSVSHNIAYGDPSPDQARIEAAAKAAHAHEFVTEMAEGYQTRLGERGSRLSGGQRQRIAIARALYKDAPVIILDEATSALDSQSESLIQDALEQLLKGRTVFVIAHRLSTIQAADKIVVMSEGRIVESGTHDELVSLGGTYQRLNELQRLGADAS